MVEVVQFPGIVNGVDKSEIFSYLIDLNGHLKTHTDPDYGLYLGQLTQLIEHFKVEQPSRAKSKTAPTTDEVKIEDKISLNIYKLVSRNLVLVFNHFTTKVYDFANGLLNNLQLNDQNDQLNPLAGISTIVLIDLFENFPNSLGSIINFSINQIYKILKKSPNVNSSLIYLLNSITKNATKLDIDEKLQAKLLKIVTKNILNHPISYDTSSKLTDNDATSTVLLKKNYILCLKNLILLGISTNYENLLTLSTSSNSAGSKMKPEAIMSQQHQYQVNLLSSHEKILFYCLYNYNQEIRVAIIDLIANVLINFVSTGKFNPVEYLIGLYNLPPVNSWDTSFSATLDPENDLFSLEIRKDKNMIGSHDSETIVHTNSEFLLFQTSIVEALVLYLQLEQFQNSEYLSTNLIAILDGLLSKFGELNSVKNHIQNQHWNKALAHLSTIVDFIIKETGSSCYEILTGYIYSKFNLEYNNEKSTIDTESHSNRNSINPSRASLSVSSGSRNSVSLNKKRESILFGFKGKTSSKGKHKDAKFKEIRPYHNCYQAYLLLQIFDLLVPYGINFNSVTQSKSTLDPKTAVHASSGEDGDRTGDEPQNRAIEEEETEESKTQENSFMRDILFKLIINDNAYIRNYALKSLLLYAKVNEVEINLLVLQAFSKVNQEFKSSDSEKSANPTSAENLSGSASTRLLNYSLVLSSLIKQTDSILLQNSTIVKILSFCTQNLKHNNSNNRNNFLKNSSCWVILSSLVTFYNDSEFVKLNSSQFLVFWKGLLTSQFISSSLGGTDSAGTNESREIIDNLKLRNFSLVCLLNYISSVELSPESLKQIQFLLTKSYNYLTYLESNIESVGPFTNFSSPNSNEGDYSPNLLNNIQYTSTQRLSSDRVMISLILYSKKIILQSFSKLATVLKNDVNSNMMIFLIKMFSDSKIFGRVLGNENEKLKSKSGSGAGSGLVRLNDFDEDAILLGEEYNYSFGITSKFRGNESEIDQLVIKSSPPNDDWGFEYKDPFSTNEELSLSRKFHTWIDSFEHLVFKSVDHSINYDPNIYLTDRYSNYEKYSPNLITSLIDLSIELFELVFPNLSFQVQSSLLEQMRNSLTSKIIDPLRLKAIKVNVSLALHGLLQNIIKRKSNIEPQIIKIIGEILSIIDTKNSVMISINSDSVGLIGQLSQNQLTIELVDRYIADIVNDSSPLSRGYSILTLAKIYRHSRIKFNDIYNIASQLLNDPNPIVYSYSLEAIIILFESNVDCVNFIPETLAKVYSNFLNDEFGHQKQNKILVNLRCKYGSSSLLSRLLKVFVTSLGPRLREIGVHEKLKIKNLIIALSSGVDLATIADYTDSYKYLLTLFRELIIFDPKLIEDEVDFFTELLNLIISKNLKIGLVSPSPTSIQNDSIFPFNTSTELYEAAYECYVELVKIYGAKVLTKDTVNLLWISMNLKPCKQLKQLITIWLELSLEMNWFLILSSLFKFSSKKLIGPFIDANYQQKLLPLQQRQKKKVTAKVDFKDEEIENIVGDDSAGLDKNEPITWEFKLFIYDLLNHLLDIASKNSNLVDSLKDKIQEIVKISFLGSTSPISIIKLRGVNLLDKVLGLFGHMADPLYPGVSILEQQQAQIISALIPCFNRDNDARVIVNTINVSSKFISLPRIKFYSKQRILKTLIYLLEEISAAKYLKFGFLENMSEFGRKSIQLSILNCWALLKIDAEEDRENSEPELLETLEKYSALLTSLWILVLRDFSTLKFNESSSKELEIYGSYWINFISVLSIELKSNPKFINEYLAGDAQNFFFVLFSQCVESLIKNKNVIEILTSLNRLVHSSDLVNLLFHDDIFGELIDLFDRLILIDDNTEVQCELVEIISTIASTYIESNGVEGGFDKLFELIRVEMLPLFSILPFLRSDYDADNDSQRLVLKHADSAPNLLILKKTLEKLVQLMSRFPDIVKVDLYSCLLFIFSKIYDYKNELLISVVLPHLKQIIGESSKFEANLVKNFSEIIGSTFVISEKAKYTIFTSMILITSGNIQLDQKQSTDLSESLVKLLEQKESATMAIQCIKSLNQYVSRTRQPLLVIKYLVTDFIKVLSSNGTSGHHIEPKLAFEILFIFTKVVDDEVSIAALYSILIPLLVRYNDDEKITKAYLHEKLLVLLKNNHQSFKLVVNERLSDPQKRLTEELVKLDIQGGPKEEAVDVQEIELKQFGLEE